MYSFSVTQQLVVFLQSFAMGMLLSAGHGAVYFFFGFFTSDRKIRYMISDAVFSVCGVFSLFCFFLAYNLGKIRLYSVLGIFFGAVIYTVAFSDLTKYIGDAIISLVRKILCIPLRPIKKIFRKICKKINKKSPKCIAKKKENVV